MVDAARFRAAATIISTIVVLEAAPQREDTHLRSQMSAGVKHLVGDRILGHVLVGFGLTMLVIGVGGQAVAPVMWLLLLFLVVFGMSLPPLTIADMTLLQRRTPQPLMGRVFTAAEVVMSAPRGDLTGARLVARVVPGLPVDVRDHGRRHRPVGRLHLGVAARRDQGRSATAPAGR